MYRNVVSKLRRIPRNLKKIASECFSIALELDPVDVGALTECLTGSLVLAECKGGRGGGEDWWGGDK